MWYVSTVLIWCEHGEGRLASSPQRGRLLFIVYSHRDEVHDVLLVCV